MIFCNGRRSRSRSGKQAQLSIDTIFQGLILHVWEDSGGPEGKRITYTFYPDPAFAQAMIDQGKMFLSHLDAEETKRKKPATSNSGG